MAQPSSQLFNAGAVPAGWATQPAGGTVAVEGASGAGALRVTGAGRAWYQELGTAVAALYAVLEAGDFDYAVVFEHPTAWTGNNLGSGPSLMISAADGSVHRFFKQEAYPPGADAFVFPYALSRTLGGGLADEWIADLGNGARGFLGPIGDKIRRFVLRVTRVGTTIRLYIPVFTDTAGLAWRECGAGAADPLAGGAGRIQIAADVGIVVVCRGFLKLTAGALDAPTAPTGGLAFSAPSADDSDLGVACVWAAPAAAVARTYEVQFSTDVGFTGIAYAPITDKLMAGQKPRASIGGLAAGATIYARARFVDELGQTGAWSATISATAAVTPSVSPSFIYPAGKFRLPERRFRV